MIVHRGLGATCTSLFWDIVNPLCWITDPSGTLPDIQINEATCTSGTLDQQTACRNGVIAAQQEASANPDYNAVLTGNELGYATGLTDSNGNITTGTLLTGALLVLGGIVILKALK